MNPPKVLDRNQRRALARISDDFKVPGFLLAELTGIRVPQLKDMIRDERVFRQRALTAMPPKPGFAKEALRKASEDKRAERE